MDLECRREMKSAAGRELVPASKLVDYTSDRIGGALRRLVLPDPNDGPTLRFESCVRIGVAAPVALDLRPPPLGVLLRPGAVLGAPVPEAPVDEDRNPKPGKGDVGAAPEVRQGIVDPKAEPAAVEQRAKSGLCSGVPLSLRLHATQGIRRGSGRVPPYALGHRDESTAAMATRIERRKDEGAGAVTFNLRSALDAVPLPSAAPSTGQKRQYSDDLSRVFSKALEDSMQTHFPHTFSGGGTGIPAASAQGIKSIDVAFNIEGLFLGLGISVKTVGLPEKGHGYVHNLKRVSEEWALETINYHRYMPFSIIIGMFFVPFDAATDRLRRSSLARSVGHFAPSSGRRDHREYDELMERIYIGLYQPKPRALYGTVRFIDVADEVPPSGLPTKATMKPFEQVKDELVALFKERNPKLRISRMP